MIRQSGIQNSAVTADTNNTSDNTVLCPHSNNNNNNTVIAKTPECDPLDDIPFPGDPMLCDLDVTEALGEMGVDIDVEDLDLDLYS